MATTSPLRAMDDARVTIDVACERALRSLDTQRPTRSSRIADAVWPGHDMTPQGAAFAVSRIVRKLIRQDQVAHRGTGYVSLQPKLW